MHTQRHLLFLRRYTAPTSSRSTSSRAPGSTFASNIRFVPARPPEAEIIAKGTGDNIHSRFTPSSEPTRTRSGGDRLSSNSSSEPTTSNNTSSSSSETQAGNDKSTSSSSYPRSGRIGVFNGNIRFTSTPFTSRDPSSTNIRFVPTESIASPHEPIPSLGINGRFAPPPPAPRSTPTSTPAPTSIPSQESNQTPRIRFHTSRSPELMDYRFISPPSASSEPTENYSSNIRSIPPPNQPNEPTAGYNGNARFTPLRSSEPTEPTAGYNGNARFTPLRASEPTEPTAGYNGNTRFTPLRSPEPTEPTTVYNDNVEPTPTRSVNSYDPNETYRSNVRFNPHSSYNPEETYTSNVKFHPPGWTPSERDAKYQTSVYKSDHIAPRAIQIAARIRPRDFRDAPSAFPRLIEPPVRRKIRKSFHSNGEFSIGHFSDSNIEQIMRGIPTEEEWEEWWLNRVPQMKPNPIEEAEKKAQENIRRKLSNAERLAAERADDKERNERLAMKGEVDDEGKKTIGVKGPPKRKVKDKGAKILERIERWAEEDKKKMLMAEGQKNEAGESKGDGEKEIIPERKKTPEKGIPEKKPTTPDKNTSPQPIPTPTNNKKPTPPTPPTPPATPAKTKVTPDKKKKDQIIQNPVEPEHRDLRKGSKPEFEGDVNPKTGEVGGPKNDPIKWGADGDWSYNGRVSDF